MGYYVQSGSNMAILSYLGHIVCYNNDMGIPSKTRARLQGGLGVGVFGRKR